MERYSNLFLDYPHERQVGRPGRLVHYVIFGDIELAGQDVPLEHVSLVRQVEEQEQADPPRQDKQQGYQRPDDGVVQQVPGHQLLERGPVQHPRGGLGLLVAGLRRGILDQARPGGAPLAQRHGVAAQHAFLVPEEEASGSRAQVAAQGGGSRS